jgi:S-adenosylmethionine/arginine decarboxylase-like enzyme
MEDTKVLLEELLNKLTAKPVYKTIHRIIEGKAKSRGEELKGLYSLAVHICIELEKGNNKFVPLLNDVQGKINKLRADAVTSTEPAAGKTIFGWHTSIDLAGCNENVLSAIKLNEWCAGLVKQLGMKTYGECITPYFGAESEITKGYSLVQLIETSLISGHFSDHYRSAHIDIFSCKPYEGKTALLYTFEFFGGRIENYSNIVRYCN